MKISEFVPENFHFLVVKFSVYLNRLVFVMDQLLRVNTAVNANLAQTTLKHCKTSHYS